jgi:hypothetical protein
VRKVFKGGNYSKAETIRRNIIRMITKTLTTYKWDEKRPMHFCINFQAGKKENTLVCASEVLTNYLM